MSKIKLKCAWISEELHALLKQRAALEGVTIHEVAERILTEALNAKI